MGFHEHDCFKGDNGSQEGYSASFKCKKELGAFKPLSPALAILRPTVTK